MSASADLKKLLDASSRVVFLTGAGISTASGLSDFRGKEGLERRKSPVPYEELLSIDFFENDPKTFYEYYKKFLIVGNAAPNVAHRAIASLGDKVTAVVTQNIDGLHQLAGSKNVIEIHGTTREYRCVRCRRRYPEDYILGFSGVPRCDCGAILRPDIVFYGETLDDDKVAAAISHIRACDLLVVVGSSLVVYPAAGLIRYKKPSAALAIVNFDPTPYDAYADVVVNDDISKVFAGIGKE